mmetsp:Transcript_74577/g.131823  ORF Transcript_74577/g.131823 Transcript_74577/m.131823 type:complete len:92 (+) Transcript_74577:661-936(+)
MPTCHITTMPATPITVKMMMEILFLLLARPCTAAIASRSPQHILQHLRVPQHLRHLRLTALGSQKMTNKRAITSPIRGAINGTPTAYAPKP